MQLYDVNEFRASKNWPYAICAGCVIFRKDSSNKVEVLLLKRLAENTHTAEDFVTYHLPKGHNQLNETLLETAVRETTEETGSRVRTQTYLGALNKEYTYRGDFYSRTFHYFAALWEADTGEIDQEHDEKVWVSLDDAEKLLGPPNPKGEDEIIRRFQKYLELTK